MRYKSRHIVSNIKKMVRDEAEDKHLGALVRQYVQEIVREEQLKISNNSKRI